MAASTWISLLALLIAALSPFAATLRADARRDGKIDAAIETLTRIAGDHEMRLRARRM